MSLKKIKLVSTLSLCCGLTAAVPVNAITSVSLTPSTTSIEVGDTFEVTVGVQDIDPGLGGLFGWGFMIDPVSSLSSISFQGATVLSPFSTIENAAGSVVGDDWLVSTAGATSVDLATLSFIAVGTGVDTLLVEGVNDGFYGLYFEQDGLSISETLDVTVGTKTETVPDSPILGGLGLLSLLTFFVGGRALFDRKRLA